MKQLYSRTIIIHMGDNRITDWGKTQKNLEIVHIRVYVTVL